MLLELNRRSVQQILRDEKGRRWGIVHKQKMNASKQ
ncbi:hypothetical protein BCE_3159 [Bacillus cereus ATCC 10987]|uniref:Uncharacterized protein n=1 Tax=Bacillus cereus (strain ATCC 10987 / NRS 248) TaxID=222523 RepID=Q735J3_BACC1|nr:hypothetical protein BCE_3159 [Bacillus cereus ATCC 10987]